MIDDIVQMIFTVARARDSKDLVYEIMEVMKVLNICVDQAISVYVQEQKNLADQVAKDA